MSDEQHKPLTPSYEELERRGEVRASNFVPALRGEVLPPVRNVPNVVDPYAGNLPANQQVTRNEINPVTRAQAMIMKSREVTIFLGVLTASLMYLMNWYPHTWQMFAIFVLWAGFVSGEWFAMFALLAMLDFWETPAAFQWRQWKDYFGAMDDERQHRVRAMYPDQYDANGKRKW